MARILIASRFRTGFLIQLVAVFLMLTAVTVALLVLSFAQNVAFYTTVFFWMGCITALGTVASVMALINRDLKRVLVTDTEIIVQAILSKHLWRINLADIKEARIERVDYSRGKGRSPGYYYRLMLLASDGDDLSLTEDEFRNWAELKKVILSKLSEVAAKDSEGAVRSM